MLTVSGTESPRMLITYLSSVSVLLAEVRQRRSACWPLWWLGSTHLEVDDVLLLIESSAPEQRVEITLAVRYGQRLCAAVVREEPLLPVACRADGVAGIGVELHEVGRPIVPASVSVTAPQLCSALDLDLPVQIL